MRYSQGRIALGNRVVAYAVRQSARAKRLGLWVDPATGVVVTLPRGFSARRIEPFLARHERWILRQLERLEHAVSQIPPRWPYGTTLPYRGDEHAVLIRPAARSAADCVIRHSLRRPPAVGGGCPPRSMVSRESERTLVVSMRAPGIEGARRLLRRWYHGEATRWLAQRVAELSARLGLSVKRMSVRNPRWRWGSCSPTGSLSFNYRLVMAPPDVLDYVVVHELVHLKFPNHSKQFWALVAAHHTDPRACRAWLRAFGSSLGV